MTQLKIKKVSKIKRFFCDLFDFILASIVTLVLFSLVFQPLFNSTTKYKETYSSYYKALNETGLYIYDSTKYTCNIITPSFSEGHDPVAKDYYDFYHVKVSDFYNENGKPDRFFELQSKSKIFTYVEGKFVLKEDATIKEVYSFYISAIKVATNEIFLENVENANLKKTLNSYYYAMIFLSIITSVLVLFVGVPLLLDDGQTLGKKVFNIKVASLKTGYKVKIKTMLYRQVIVIIVGYIAGTFTFFLSTIAFYVVSCINKESKSIADILANTVLYDNVNPEEGDEVLYINIVEDEVSIKK